MPILPEDIDDVFRQQLGGHPTPPPPDLWARLQQHTAGEAVDQLFQAGLGGHASQPSRAVWERLEDEHLRPRPKRRVVGWWQLSAAAVVLLMLLAGGAGLWRGGLLKSGNQGLATADRVVEPGDKGVRTAAAGPERGLQSPRNSGNAAAQAAVAPPAAASTLAAASPASKKNQESFSTQATAPAALTSSTPIATTTRPRRPATVPQAAGSFQQKGHLPDAATAALARTEGRKTSGGQASTTPPTAPAPAAATPTLAVATALATEVIEVEVRRGGGPTATAPTAVVAAADVAPAPRRRLRLGGLLRQADHLVHGEPVSLADAIGPAETVTVQARLGGRVLSRTIDL